MAAATLTRRWALCAIACAALSIAWPSTAHATRVRIDARTTLVLPRSGVPAGAFIVVDHLRDRRARMTPGLVAPPFVLRLQGARRLARPARLEFRYPAGLHVRAFRIGIWQPQQRRWKKLVPQVDRGRHVAWVRTTLSRGGDGSARAANVIDWGMGVFAEFGQFWGEVLQKRANRPDCSSDTPAWVQSVTFANDAREPVFSCGMHDPHNGDVLEVRVVNNRSYGMWVSFDGTQPDWVWLDFPGIFFSDLRQLLSAQSRLIPSHENDVFLPPTSEAHIGFSDRTHTDFALKTRPATELVIASGAMSILSSRLIGLRNKLMLAPLFTCDASAGSVWQSHSPREIAGAILACARKTVDAIAAHKMAFLDNATPAWLGIKSRALAELAAAMSVVDFSFQTTDLIEIWLGSSWRTITVKHTFVQTPRTGPVTEPTPTPRPTPTPTPTPTPSPQTWAEQETPNHPVNTFTNYHNASGMGSPIAAGQWVQVSCKVYDPYIASVNPDGYWYRIASAPWNNAYYSPANTFMNGDPYGGPYTHNTDFAVPNC